MKDKKILYYVVIIVAVILIMLSFIVFKNTVILGPIVLVIGIYLLLGGIIKFCKMNDKLKKSILCLVDLLFWLP